MPNMILCMGVRANTPYYFEISETNVYSIEELVFYLYQNLYGLQEETLDDSLAGWIRSELKMPETAEKLSKMVQEGQPAKHRVLLLFRSCNYYSEEEIFQAAKVLDEIERLSAFGRLKLKAENSLRYHNYVRAAYLYESLLKRPEAAQLAPEEYGMILHNQAIAHVYTMSCRDAAPEFREAYERCHEEECLWQYFYALLIAGQEQDFEKAVKKYQISEEKAAWLREQISEAYIRSQKTPEAWQLRHTDKLRESGKAQEYYESVQSMLEHWKQDCRKYLQ